MTVTVGRHLRCIVGLVACCCVVLVAWPRPATAQNPTVEYLKALRELNADLSKLYPDYPFENAGSKELFAADIGKYQGIAALPVEGVDPRLLAFVEEAQGNSAEWLDYVAGVYNLKEDDIKRIPRELWSHNSMEMFGDEQARRDSTTDMFFSLLSSLKKSSDLIDQKTAFDKQHAALQHQWHSLLKDLRDDHFPSTPVESLGLLEQRLSPLVYVQNPITEFQNIGKGSSERARYSLGRLTRGKFFRVAHAKASWRCYLLVPGSKIGRASVNFSDTDAPVFIREVGDSWRSAIVIRPGKAYSLQLRTPTTIELSHVYKVNHRPQANGSGVAVVAWHVGKWPRSITDGGIEVVRLTFPEGADVETDEPTDERAEQFLAEYPKPAEKVTEKPAEKAAKEAAENVEYYERFKAKPLKPEESELRFDGFYRGRKKTSIRFFRNGQFAHTNVDSLPLETAEALLKEENEHKTGSFRVSRALRTNDETVRMRAYARSWGGALKDGTLSLHFMYYDSEEQYDDEDEYEFVPDAGDQP